MHPVLEFYGKFEYICVNQDPLIMEHPNSETTLSHEELEFRDLVQHGDDFFRIQLLRHARSWYKKALPFNMDTEILNQKIAECNKFLSFERKVIWILLAIAAAAILTWYFLSK